MCGESTQVDQHLFFKFRDRSPSHQPQNFPLKKEQELVTVPHSLASVRSQVQTSVPPKQKKKKKKKEVAEILVFHLNP
jgi:hypothetical protein